MKHIVVELHFVRDYVARGALKVNHVLTQDQLANMLTKPVSHLRFQHLSSKTGVIDGTPILWGRISDINAPQSIDITHIKASPSIASMQKIAPYIP